jgi:hypothetical protein
LYPPLHRATNSASFCEDAAAMKLLLLLLYDLSRKMVSLTILDYK